MTLHHAITRQASPNRDELTRRRWKQLSRAAQDGEAKDYETPKRCIEKTA
jgi:hypothetical protein